MTVKEFLEHYDRNFTPAMVEVLIGKELVGVYQGDSTKICAVDAFKELIDTHGDRKIKDYHLGWTGVTFELEQEQDKRVYEIVKDILERFENSPDDPEREGYLSDGEWLDEFYHSVTRIKAILEEEAKK